MTFTIPAVAPHAQAVVDQLATNGDGVLVDRGRKPDGAGWQGDPGKSRFKGYMVVHPLDGGAADGPAADPSADIHWPFQITCVGATADQADRIADLAGELLMGSRDAITVPGRRLVQPITRPSTGPARQDRTLGDDQTLFYATPRFEAWTTPTT